MGSSFRSILLEQQERHVFQLEVLRPVAERVLVGFLQTKLFNYRVLEYTFGTPRKMREDENWPQALDHMVYPIRVVLAYDARPQDVRNEFSMYSGMPYDLIRVKKEGEKEEERSREISAPEGSYGDEANKNLVAAVKKDIEDRRGGFVKALLDTRAVRKERLNGEEPGKLVEFYVPSYAMGSEIREMMGRGYYRVQKTQKGLLLRGTDVIPPGNAEVKEKFSGVYEIVESYTEGLHRYAILREGKGDAWKVRVLDLDSMQTKVFDVFAKDQIEARNNALEQAREHFGVALEQLSADEPKKQEQE